MSFISHIQSSISNAHIPILITIALMTFAGLYLGKTMKYIKLPSIIGFMIIGVILGPSLLNILTEGVQSNLEFITEIALGFVAVTIGLELDLTALRNQGLGIVLIIIAESILAFILVTVAIYLVSNNLPLAIIFGAIAPASAPAGTVAIIQEYKAHGSLTKALYTVVGFDDGLGIIIFGFAAAIAKNLLAGSTAESTSFITLLAPPFKEVVLSIFFGIAMGFTFSLLAKRLKQQKDIFILTFASCLFLIGLSHQFHLSLILTNMVFGLFVVNTQSKNLVKKMGEEVTRVMPLLFVLFFVLAGSNLHISALPALGLIGVVYVLARSFGLMGGAYLGATISGADEKIKKYLGMGILSQAGVAIGLSLIVKNEFQAFGDKGALIGSTVITTITATCIFFEIIGPILTKIGLKKAGEINVRE